MARLIDADALCRHLSNWQYGSMTDGKHDVEYGVIENVIEGIGKEPTIEAIPIKWIIRNRNKHNNDGFAWIFEAVLDDWRREHGEAD